MYDAKAETLAFQFHVYIIHMSEHAEGVTAPVHSTGLRNERKHTGIAADICCQRT